MEVQNTEYSLGIRNHLSSTINYYKMVVKDTTRIERKIYPQFCFPINLLYTNEIPTPTEMYKNVCDKGNKSRLRIEKFRLFFHTDTHVVFRYMGRKLLNRSNTYAQPQNSHMLFFSLSEKLPQIFCIKIFYLFRHAKSP